MTTEHLTETIRKWIRYEDGSYEPVRLDGSLLNKRRGLGIPDWWVVDMPRHWEPAMYGYETMDNHPSGPLTARRDSASQPDFRIERDNEGRISKRVFQIQGLPREYDYAYDEEGRLVEVRGNGKVREWYGYDAEGRRAMDLLARYDNHERRFEYDGNNRLVRAGQSRFEHDAFGFRSARIDALGRTEYDYAPDFRLREIRLPDGTKVGYAYNDDELPCARYVNGYLKEAYRWLEPGRLAAFHDGENLYRFLYHDDERLPYAMNTDRAVLFLRYDQEGSLVSVANDRNAIIKYVEYDSFGNILRDTHPALTIPMGFAGGLHDPLTGLVRFGWRDYDPDTGRWTAPDPNAPSSEVRSGACCFELRAGKSK